MRVYLTSLGCKLNQSEAEGWARRLAAAGCDVVADPSAADLCIVNTCTVTHIAARKSRQVVRRCARANACAPIMVTGCYVEISPTEAAQLPGVCLVLGSEAKEHMVEIVADRLGFPLADKGSSVPRVPLLHTRAFVKIQDGCDNACTYCIVRIARGRHRSRPETAVIEEVLAREGEGYQEIVFTGVHIGAYGREWGQTLVELVQTTLAKTRLPRLRLSSIEPQDLSPDLLRLWENPRMCRHLHLPLQSGCSATLQRMNRRYTTDDYRGLLLGARAAIPGLAVTTDVIVGFPGESEREFQVSAQFIERMGFARTHVFPFSGRPGTEAMSMPDHIPPQVKKARAARTRATARRGACCFQQGFLGDTMDVLWEGRNGNTWNGLTDNYIRVEAESTQDLSNRILPVRLVECVRERVWGELVADSDS